MPSHILHVLQQRGFVVKECRYKTGLPAVQTCLPLKMCGALWSTKYDSGDQTVEQLNLYIKQEWEGIPIPTYKKLVSSGPKRLLSVVKRKSDVTQW